MSALRPQAGALAMQMDEHDLMNVLRNSLYPGSTDESIKLVLGYCKASGLDPMQKPVHIVPMWDSKARVTRDVVMPGIGLYRTQAARSGQFAGMSEPKFGPMVTQKLGVREVTFPEWCKVTAYRQLPSGHVAEFTAVEYWIENYAVKGGKEHDQSPNAMWSKRVRGQLAKCTQAQALRMAFPEAVGSAPTAEEMEGKTIDGDFTVYTPDRQLSGQTDYPPHQRERSPEKPAYTDESIDKNREQWLSLIGSGKKTAAQIIAAIETKATLSDAQKAEIESIGAQTEAEETTEAEDAEQENMNEESRREDH